MKRRAILACLALAAVLSGCASPRNALGTGSSICFKAIPPAVSAVSHKGTLVGVREVRASTLAQRRPEFTQFGSETLCLVAFKDGFQPGDVPSSTVQEAGNYAVVAVDSRDSKVLAAWVSQDLPIRFRHPV